MDRKKLMPEVKLVNRVIHNIETATITETNYLLLAGAYIVAERLGKIKTRAKEGNNNRQPFWKRRIEKSIAEWRKDISKLEATKKGHVLLASEKERMNRKYALEENGRRYVMELLRSKITAGAQKVKSYEKRMKQNHQNKLFSTDQRRLYQELNGGEQTNEAPDAKEATQFWKGRTC